MEIGRNKLTRLLVSLVLGGWTLFTCGPLYWMAVTSFKSSKAIFGDRPTFFPFVDFWPTLQPWLGLFGLGHVPPTQADAGLKLGRFALNSLVAASTSALLVTILGTLAAYGLARFQYRRIKNNHLAFFLIAQRMLPPIALAVPFFILFNLLNMVDTLPTLILVYTVMNLPLMVWLLRDYFRDLPAEIEEAALVDGCSRLQAFRRIVLPLTAPGLVVAFLVAFVFAWNEYIYALTLTFADATTLTVHMASKYYRFADVAAQAGLMLLPPILVTIFTGRFIIRGLARGAGR